MKIAAQSWVCALCLGFCASAKADSLLSNAGFESDTNNENRALFGWQTYGPNTFNEANSAIAHHGTNYFKVYQAFTGTVNYTGIYQDYISGPGAAYSADGWAYTAGSDALAGQNAAWIEVSFRDALGNALALYRSAVVTTNSIATGAFPKNQWNDLAVTNQYDPNTYELIGTVTKFTAPAGTIFLHYQIVFQGDANYSGGSVYFDDLNLVLGGGTPYGNYNIVWSDEFSGTNLNANIWTYDLGGGGWGNQELEYYTSRTNNAFVSNGLLHIVARREATNGYNYTSARLKSQGLFSFQYGRVEWRAKLPQGVGFWPALWMLGTNITSVGWPGCGEIDVMENVGTDSFMAQGSIHSGSDATAIYDFIDGQATTNFNTYTADWTTNAILFYVNGHLYETQTDWSSSAGAYPFPFNQPFFLLMNLAVGGTYLGNPTTNAINTGTTFPGEMLVDYVRLCQVTDPFRITVHQSSTNIVLSWPSNIVCCLQMQSNGLDSNWSDVPTATNQIQVMPINRSAFYRLVTP
jgi:beta-glucanase (GH16 family)